MGEGCPGDSFTPKPGLLRVEAVLLDRTGRLPSSLEPKSPPALCQDPRAAFSVLHLHALDIFLGTDVTLGGPAHLRGAWVSVS